MGRLSGKVAAITGATSGIGEATARVFIEEGAKVVVSGRNIAKGEALARELGSAAAFERADVTVEADVARLVEAAAGRFGRLDCLFSNAGEGNFSGVADITEADLEFNFRTLVWSVVFGAKHAVRRFRAQGGGGVVLSNASIAGSRTGYGPHLYSAAKATVIHLSKSYAAETAVEGIRFNTISPGVIVTPIFAKALGAGRDEAAEKAPRLADAFAAAAPLGRAGWPVDIARTAAFLASDEASFITAQDFVVDGGVIAGRTTQEMEAQFAGLGQIMGLAASAPAAA